MKEKKDKKIKKRKQVRGKKGKGNLIYMNTEKEWRKGEPKTSK